MISFSILIMIWIYNGAYHFISILNEPNTYLFVNIFVCLVWILFCLFLLLTLNIWSEETSNEIKQLHSHLRNIIVLTEKFMDFEGQRAPLSIVKGRIEEQLSEFQGFDGKGYFTLGKSFLKNLLAFCATYFIILIQFKMTEPTTSSLNVHSNTTSNWFLLYHFKLCNSVSEFQHST